MHPALLATDQTRCYTESGEKMPCAGSGQDAAFKNWTGDACRRLSDQAWHAHMGGGRIHRGMKYGKNRGK